MAAKQEFASRFAKHKDELEWLFMEQIGRAHV